MDRLRRPASAERRAEERRCRSAAWTEGKYRIKVLSVFPQAHENPDVTINVDLVSPADIWTDALPQTYAYRRKPK